MSSTTNPQVRHARNRRAFAYTYSRCAQMLAGHDRAALQGYLRTWNKRLKDAPFGSELYARALGATTYLQERLGARACQRRPRSARRSFQRYSVRGSKW